MRKESGKTAIIVLAVLGLAAFFLFYPSRKAPVLGGAIGRVELANVTVRAILATMLKKGPLYIEDGWRDSNNCRSSAECGGHFLLQQAIRERIISATTLGPLIRPYLSNPETIEIVTFGKEGILNDLEVSVSIPGSFGSKREVALTFDQIKGIQGKDNRSMRMLKEGFEKLRKRSPAKAPEAMAAPPPS